MKRTLLAATLATLGSTTTLAEPGYVTSPFGGPVMTPYGQCVHSGTWTPDQAVAPCDVVPQASAAPAPVVRAEPAPAPAPAPLAQQESPRGPMLEKVALSTDVLFEFSSATLKDSGKEKLDELAGRTHDATLDSIVATGHADRIGKDDYNQKLSERRAEAVKEYLTGKVATRNIDVAGKGESEPVTGSACERMGPERKSNRKLVDCLQPDRRVEIEVYGTRTAASGEPAAAGATRR